ncbi:unnamed protein product [Litomosoides sigmodontis]|uniref:Uncharacterized protein n=1 Tax=Litomosoides sigmodontis TaxID=42156 RepID=A0A3P6SPS1_LITSI|nr:unnamed protein product [Litomosoides sigmodontis]
MTRSEKQRRTGTVALLRSNSISREPTTTYTSLRNGKSPQPRDAYIPNLETPIMQSSMHSQPVTYVQQPPPMYATQPGDPQSHRQLTSYPRQEASGSAHSHQSYATWKGATNGLQQNLMREQRTFSFHTSV